MYNVFGVAAVLMLGVSVAEASVSHTKEPLLLTSKEQPSVPPTIVLASCSGTHARMLPRCHN